MKKKVVTVEFIMLLLMLCQGSMKGIVICMLHVFYCIYIYFILLFRCLLFIGNKLFYVACIIGYVAWGYIAWVLLNMYVLCCAMFMRVVCCFVVCFYLTYLMYICCSLYLIYNNVHRRYFRYTLWIKLYYIGKQYPVCGFSLYCFFSMWYIYVS